MVLYNMSMIQKFNKQKCIRIYIICREASCVCCKEAPPSSPPFSGKMGGTVEGHDFPPPPDNFPDGWEDEWQPTLEHAEIAAHDRIKG